MKGQVLNVSIQTNTGVISGDDGNRYSFEGADWRLPVTPQRGVRVDFDTNGDQATGIYADTASTAGAMASPAVSRGPSPSVSRPAPAYQSGDTDSPPAMETVRSFINPSTMGMVGTFTGLGALILFWVPLIGGLLQVVGMGLSLTALVMGKKRGEPVGFAVAGVLVNSVTLGVRTLAAVIVSTTVSIVYGEIRQFLGPFSPILDFIKGDWYRFL